MGLVVVTVVASERSSKNERNLNEDQRVLKPQHIILEE